MKLSSYTLLSGSNMGDREAMLAKAADLISKRIGEIEAKSAIYESPAWGFHAHEAFLNQAIQVRSPFVPIQLLLKLQSIESELGRERELKPGYSSRPIDIDIIHWDGGVVNEHSLTIPHPMLQFRRFAITPVAELIGKEHHPVLQMSFREILDNLEDESEVHLFKAA